MNAETTAKIDWKRSYYAEAGKSDALRKELVALRKDAGRYRLLRNSSARCSVRVCFDGNIEWRPVGSTLDDALDATMSAERAVG